MELGDSCGKVCENHREDDVGAERIGIIVLFAILMTRPVTSPKCWSSIVKLDTSC